MQFGYYQYSMNSLLDFKQNCSMVIVFVFFLIERTVKMLLTYDWVQQKDVGLMWADECDVWPRQVDFILLRLSSPNF